MIEWQAIFNLVGGAGLAAVGWAAKTMYESIRELQRDLSAHKQEVAGEYVTNIALRRLEDKLDRVLERVR